ncbi:TIGR01906 family membrane protein [Latilactobacillus fuchuensis]|uniref:Integral membrane protein n=1 Tax=Latilactobacillus fuchuensis TaxID=164393 RepID=A0A2N9DU05_9LACO|nr:TIGR01906 family membrane protein [Latilactobacillus fuchuensis]SPC37081.1 conserved membrane hypothetical protein [Latilactobacillus fuchuensis]
MAGLKRCVVSLSGWLVTWLALLSGAVVLTCLLSWLIYPLISSSGHLAANQQLSQPQLLKNFNQLMRYLLLPGGQLRLPDFPMSANGYQHFVEVKRLFLLAEVVCLVTFWPAIWQWRRRQQQAKLWQYIAPMQIALVLPLVLGFIASMNFERFFIAFHQLLFRNLDWQFDPAVDPIILVLPASYFAICFGLFFILIEGSFGWLLWRGKRSLR